MLVLTHHRGRAARVIAPVACLLLTCLVAGCDQNDPFATTQGGANPLASSSGTVSGTMPSPAANAVPEPAPAALLVLGLLPVGLLARRRR